MKQKYNLLTAIAMVVGIVIGSGVFFKVQNILDITKGNVLTGVISLLVGGIIMIVCAITFANLATRYSKINGIVDYSDAVVGSKYGSLMAWFIATIYYPAMTSVLVWVTARYTGVLFGWDMTSSNVMILGVVYMVSIFAVNAFSPILAGKLQISTTVIKLIPLFLMGFVGLIFGLINNNIEYQYIDGEIVKTGTNTLQVLIENIKNSGEFNFKDFLGALVAAAFAYEGWMVATAISGELKDAKKNLPIALLFGAAIIMIVYILYYLGVTGGATTDVLIHGGAQYAFLEIFGDFFGTLLNVFVVISCIGTLNGLMVATTRAFFTISKREVSSKFEMFSTVDKYTNMPMNSAVIGIVLVGFWLAFFYGANLAPEGWFGSFAYDSSELPIITMYAMYFPIFILVMVRERKNMGNFKAIILPILALICSGFMVFAAIYAHGVSVLYYLIMYVVIMAAGWLLMFRKTNKTN